MFFKQLLTTTLIITSLGLSAQIFDLKKNIVSKYVGSMLNDTNDLTKPKFMTYPTLAYSPETRWNIGMSSLYIYLANRDISNRLSEVKALTFYTQNNQYGIWLDHALYTDKNTWFFLGKTRFQSMPLKYYGIGPETQKDKYEIVKGEFLLFKQRFLREFKPSFYTGLELDFQRMSNVDFPSTHISTVDKPVGSSGSTNLGVGWGLLYNNIHNAMNPRRGLFSEWAFLSYNENIGSEFNLNSFIVDNRIYIPSGKHNVFAAQLYGQFTAGNAPFNLVSLLGGENLMRGYYSGRYRDDHLLAAQVEYRLLPFPFSNRIGGSLFMAAGQVFSYENKFDWTNFLPTGGAGLRFLIFPEKDIYTRLDFAFTQEGSGVYFLIGEAF